jgi:hypothetical protein
MKEKVMKTKIFVLMVTLLTFAACGKSETAATGITVSSNKSISAYAVDMCTQYTGEFCSFIGGQKVTYSDGSILLTGQWSFGYDNGGDTDTNENTVSIWVPSSSSSMCQVLSAYVARGSGYKKIYLCYQRSNDELSIYHDSDGNGTPSASLDTKITTLTATDV